MNLDRWKEFSDAVDTRNDEEPESEMRDGIGVVTYYKPRIVKSLENYYEWEIGKLDI